MRMCLGSGRVHNASRSVAGQCVKSATSVVRQGRICLSHLKGKGMGKGICSWATWSKTRLREVHAFGCLARLSGCGY